MNTWRIEYYILLRDKEAEGKQGEGETYIYATDEDDARHKGWTWCNNMDSEIFRYFLSGVYLVQERGV